MTANIGSIYYFSITNRKYISPLALKIIVITTTTNKESYIKSIELSLGKVKQNLE